MNIYHFSSNGIRDVWHVFNTVLREKYSESECFIIFKRILDHFGYSVWNDDIRLNQSELIEISGFINELLKGKPLAYVLGYTYFYSLKFFVDENVLIPRPETEELVLHIKNFAQKKYGNPKRLKILDIGTGSGCIAITLKKIFPDVDVTAVDVLESALSVARKNALYHGVEIDFVLSDILRDELSDVFDVIVSNPPYIPIKDASSISEQVKKNEPFIALFSRSATEFYERIFVLSKKYLSTNGFILMELNQYYAEDIFQLAQNFRHFRNMEILKDWSGNKRFIYIEN